MFKLSCLACSFLRYLHRLRSIRNITVHLLAGLPVPFRGQRLPIGMSMCVLGVICCT
jgi:hypothetical protein